MFTVIHELPWVHFHFQERRLVSRTRDPDYTEHVAGVFAGYARRLRPTTKAE
jgi:hypothetical protein